MSDLAAIITILVSLGWLYVLAVTSREKKADGVAATATTAQSAEQSGSREQSAVDEIYPAEEVHLTDIDAVVTENGVGHCGVEKDIRNGHLQ